MNTKKNQNKSLPKKTSNSINHKQIMEILRQLQVKVLASAALNGGFDNLMFKIDKIEEKQESMGLKVDSIHEAIYNPDDGLYARVKDVESIKEKTLLMDKLEKDVFVLQHAYATEEKTLQKESALNNEQDKLIKLYADQIKELMFFKSKILEATKWLIYAIGGTIIAGIGKLLFDYIRHHITLQ